MKAPPRFETPKPSFATMPLYSSEFRDWSHLWDLALSDVLSRLILCLSSLSTTAATYRPWWRFFLASASTLLPRIPPLLRQLVPDSKSSRLHAFSRLVISKLIIAPLVAFPSTHLISSSRGHLMLLMRPHSLLLLIDALNSVECLALPLLRVPRIGSIDTVRATIAGSVVNMVAHAPHTRYANTNATPPNAPAGPGAPSKTRIQWMQDLHERFVDCVSQLDGADKATPKRILKLINSDGLTIYHIKSHLQVPEIGKGELLAQLWRVLNRCCRYVNS